MRQCKNAKAVSVSGLCETALERGDRGIQRGARPHRGRRLGVIGQVVAADVDWLALGADQLAIDLRLVPAERLGQRFETGLQLRVLGLRGQRLSPVQGEVELAAAIVDFADLARRIAIELEELADGGVERLGENLRLGVLVGMPQMLKRRAQREELAERIPAQIALLLE